MSVNNITKGPPRKRKNSYCKQFPSLSAAKEGNVCFSIPTPALRELEHRRFREFGVEAHFLSGELYHVPLLH